MPTGITFEVSAADRYRLEAIISARSSPQKHVWRAKVILMSGDGLGTVAIMQATSKSKTCVWRWQERFMAEGVDGLLRDKSRPPGIAPLDSELVDRVVTLTLEAPKQEATHWTVTVRAMAKAVGIAASSVVRIWHEHGLAPHRWRSFKLSNDKAFAEKLHDVVGLYVSPPAQAVVLSVDEKSQIQALDRTQPGLPIKKKRGGTMTHDNKRHGTTTLFAALNILDGSVIGHNMQRHRHQEFIRFLNAIEAELPKDKAVHVILDNYAAHSSQMSALGWQGIRDGDLSLRANILLMAQRRRGLLCKAHTPTFEARRLSFRRRSSSSHQSLHQGAQPRATTVRVESRSRRNHRRGHQALESIH